MKKILKYIGIILLLVLMITMLYQYNTSSNKLLEKQSAEQNTKQKTNLFKIDKIIAYSSANLKKNEDNQRADWEVDVYQFTDFAIYLKIAKTQNDKETTIKDISIENITVTDSPKQGTPVFYKRKLENFGDNNLDIILANQLEENSINFEEVVLPLTFGYVNKQIKSNYIIHDITEPLYYDESILKRTGIPISAIEATISFRVKIVNELEQVFEKDLELVLPITEAIYNKSQISTLNVNQNFEIITKK